ncbi:YaaC family protein [Kitasatospora griseola]|uniref:YaaC family protein n=1 Tax=Kitasatospora griseola TaxID=2064 RepID=UPI0036679313
MGCSPEDPAPSRTDSGTSESSPGPYDGSRYFFPSLGGSVISVHPLMAWWAVLHTLSTISRYQPAEWGRHIDVDRSQHAVPIERLPTESIRIMPKLLAETIGEVSDSQSRPPQRSAQPEASGAAHDSELVDSGAEQVQSAGARWAAARGGVLGTIE